MKKVKHRLGWKALSCLIKMKQALVLASSDP